MTGIDSFPKVCESCRNPTRFKYIGNLADDLRGSTNVRLFRCDKCNGIFKITWKIHKITKLIETVDDLH